MGKYLLMMNPNLYIPKLLLVCFFFIQSLSILTGIFYSLNVIAANAPIAVIYPEVREPYISIFNNIITGIKQEIKSPVYTYAVTKDENLGRLNESLSHDGIKTVIALGRRGKITAERLSDKFPVFIGAVLMTPEMIDDNYSGISLTADPRKLMARLKSIAPNVKRIIVVYNKINNGWLIDRAQKVASDYELELQAIPVDGLREAANAYRTILEKKSNGTEALWLLQDTSIFDERSILPMILKEAWKKNLAVFSSNPSHVRRGVLFALYPDNIKTGRRLGIMVNNYIQTDIYESGGMRLMRDLSIAINKRTAEHLGINLSNKDIPDFDLVFPTY